MGKKLWTVNTKFQPYEVTALALLGDIEGKRAYLIESGEVLPAETVFETKEEAAKLGLELVSVERERIARKLKRLNKREAQLKDVLAA